MTWGAYGEKKESSSSHHYELACRCAERALAKIDNPDQRSIEAIKAKRAWLRGEIDDDARGAAWAAARAAARAAAIASETKREREEQVAMLIELIEEYEKGNDNETN